MNRYVVASSRGAPLAMFSERRRQFPGTWIAIGDRADLSLDMLRSLAPRYVFFPHWSWIVGRDILEEFECVCFHMTDVPYGRGGTPLQNLIVRGHNSTRLSALRMTGELDAGPVYAKRELMLDGTAEAIYARAYGVAYDIMAWMVAHEPASVAQVGDVTAFERRKPEQSLLPIEGTIATLYDHIRMLDAVDYPKAFVQHGDWRLELSQARIDGEAVEARVRLSRRADNSIQPLPHTSSKGTKEKD